MEWTLRLEHRDAEGRLHSSTVTTIDRPELTNAGDLGLSHDTGKHLLWTVQMEVASAQVRSFIAKARQCTGCGQQLTTKDRWRRRIDTIFGQVRVSAPRFEPCRCGQVGDLSPVTSLFPHRSTPELRHLQAKLGSEFSYRQAATLLREFLPDSDRFNHATIRNRVLEIGQQIEAETVAEISNKPAPVTPTENMVVGIDGGFVGATRAHMQRRHFEVVLGRIEAPDRRGEMFAAVRDLDSLAKERIRSALRRAGRGPATTLTVLSDGEDAMQRMADDWLSGSMEHRLDWFHLNRRISWMWRAVYHTLGVGDLDPETRFNRYRRALRSVRWNLWHHGQSRHARWMIAISRLGALILSHRLEAETARQSTARIDDLHKRFEEFRNYAFRNKASLADYASHRRRGERVSTAHVESTVNQLINQRMCKKRQMRWSRSGAQLLLNVRVAHLNGRLERYTGVAQPRATGTISDLDLLPIAA
jgi:hypothetical protein